MDTHKLKVKIGQHEFEAEGTQEAVEKQFDAFKDLVKGVGGNSGSPESLVGKKAEVKPANEGLKLETIIKLDGDKVSLTAHPSGEDLEGEAVLLLLLGYKMLLAAEQVSGVQLLAAMKQSGFQLNRVATIVQQLPDGQVITTGAKKGVKYRLTNSGLARAEEIARALLATLP